MFCLNCGTPLKEGAKFCANCGATVGGASAPAAEPATTPVSTPKRSKPSKPPLSGKKLGLLIGIAAAVVVVLLVVVLLISGVFSGPKGKVQSAILKTVDAYASAAEKAALPDTSELLAGGKYSQSLSLSIEDMAEYTSMEGLGIRMTHDVDMDGQKISSVVTPFYGSVDLLTMQLALDGSRIYATSPELVDGIFYGVDTSTLGVDLDKLGADLPSEMENLGFNIFELMELAQKYSQPDDESKAALTDAFKELYKAIEVEKTGSESKKINGTSVKCTAYHVFIPQDELEDCLDALEDCMDSVDYEEMYTQIMLAMGIDEDTVEDAVDEMDFSEADMGEAFDSFKEVLDALGDIELDVYLDGGYVMAVVYDERIEGSDVELELCLGGGKNYVDDLSLTINIDGEELTITSTGDHSAKEGVFTDETIIEVDSYEVLVSEISYEADAEDGNFSWTLDMDGASVNAEGQLTVGKNSVMLNLEELELRAYGESIITLAVSYTMDSYSDKNVTVNEPVMLADMDEDDLMDLVDTIEDNGYDLVMDLSDDLAALIEDLDDLMYYYF